jgi:UDP-N-acetylmuramate-alanine ligase
MLIKGVMHQKDITINPYAHNVSPPNFIKHTLKDLKAHTYSKKVVVGDFNMPQSPIYWSSKQKIHNEILDLNDTTDQVDLIDVYRICHPAKTQKHSSQQRMELSPK